MENDPIETAQTENRVASISGSPHWITWSHFDKEAYRVERLMLNGLCLAQVMPWDMCCMSGNGNYCAKVGVGGINAGWGHETIKAAKDAAEKMVIKLASAEPN